jgi:hypothetical protein
MSADTTKIELEAVPYTIRLDVECEDCCRGSLVRLPDGVEASFNCADGLLVLLECMGGRGWWQDNRTHILERVLPFLKARRSR